MFVWIIVTLLYHLFSIRLAYLVQRRQIQLIVSLQQGRIQGGRAYRVLVAYWALMLLFLGLSLQLRTIIIPPGDMYRYIGESFVSLKDLAWEFYEQPDLCILFDEANQTITRKSWVLDPCNITSI